MFKRDVPRMLSSHFLPFQTAVKALIALQFFFSPLRGQDCAFQQVVHHSCDRSDLNGLSIAKVVYDREKFYVFYVDTNLYSLIELGEGSPEHRLLKTCEPFWPNTVISGGGMNCFLDYEKRYIVKESIEPAVENKYCLDVTALDRKHRGRWLTRFRQRRPLRFDGKNLCMLVSGGGPAQGRRATKRFYQRQNIIACFDLSGRYDYGFARYDSIFTAQVNIQWARDMFAAFCRESEEYLVGSYIIPGITRYNAAGKYLGRSGLPTNNFNQTIKAIESNREQIFLGMKYDIEHNTFGEILIDTGTNRVLQFFYEAEEDTAMPDMDFLHLLFFGKDLNDICLRPNPILNDQGAHFFAMPLKILVYDRDLNFREVIATNLDRSDVYVGSDSDNVHYFSSLTERELVITGYSLTCAE